MNTTSDLKTTFYRPILKAFAVMLGGFLLAPTHILLSLYEQYPIARGLVILLGSLIVVCALINVISISLRAINAAGLGRKIII